MIYGWPEQNEESLLNDLKVIVDQGVKHITHYELNIAGKYCPSYFAQNLKDKIPSIEDTINLYHSSKNFLLSKGYKQLTSYDFMKDDGNDENFLFEKNVRNVLSYDNERGFVGTDMLGLGFGALNCLTGTFEKPGTIYINHIDLEKYYSCIEKDNLPFMTGYLYEDKDLKLAVLFHMIQSLCIDVKICEKLFNTNVVDDYSHIWKVLTEMGWIKIKDGNIHFINNGEFRTPLIQGLIANERKKEIEVAIS